jgi:hypothetical protein
MNTRYSLTLFSLIHIICDTYCHNLLNKCFRSSIFLIIMYFFVCSFYLTSIGGVQSRTFSRLICPQDTIQNQSIK